MTTTTLTKLTTDIAIVETMLSKLKRQLAQAQSESQGFIWEEVSDRILILRDPQRRNGWEHLTYLGFSRKADAQACLGYLLKHQLAGAIEGARPAERVAAGKWELKIQNLNPSALSAIVRKQAAAEAA